MQNEDFFYEVEMASLLEIEVSTLRKKLCLGEDLPPAKKIGRKTVFPKKAYRVWLDKKPEVKPGKAS